VKTTVELPDTLFRKAKAAAAEEGKSLKDFFAEALKDRLRRPSPELGTSKAWEAAFGGLHTLHRENLRINRIISAEFESVDEDEWH